MVNRAGIPGLRGPRGFPESWDKADLAALIRIWMISTPLESLGEVSTRHRASPDILWQMAAPEE